LNCWKKTLENKGLVWKFIRQKYSWIVRKHPFLDIEDLVQIGMIGLYKAVKGHDERKGKLSTYASFFIKRALFDSFDDRESIDLKDDLPHGVGRFDNLFELFFCEEIRGSFSWFFKFAERIGVIWNESF